MADTPLAKKLGMKPGRRVLLLNAPPGYRARLDPLPAGVSLAEAPDGAGDLVLLFVHDQAESAHFAPAALAPARPDTLLWIAYPKRSAKVATDLTRDSGWDVVRAGGWHVVAVVAIDATWSALRFRPGA